MPLRVTGYELQDELGRVCAEAKLAWPGRKVTAPMPENSEHKNAFESRGWQVFDAAELIKKEAQVQMLLTE